VQLVVTEIVDQDKPSFNEAEVKAFEILQQKRDAGYLDVDGFIKQQLLQDQKVSIDILVGRTGIIHSDITGQLKDAIGFYQISFVPINLSNEVEIIDSLENSNADVIAIARGGGERMEIFDKPSIAEAAINLDAYFITALGHAQDVPLLQKVADKAFNTPTALGQHLSDLYNHVIEERSQSKAGLTEAVIKTLKPLYEKEIQNLRTDFANKELHYQNQYTLLEERLKLTPPPPKVNWVVIVGVLVTGMVIGAAVLYFFFR
jgi:exodeoxyribonuclease VII large subunit